MTERPLGIAERNPCPQCQGVPSHMAGVNVPNGRNEWNYLVCWSCGMVRQIKKGSVWERWRKVKPLSKAEKQARRA